MTLIKGIAKNNLIDGFTITGGDPMYQADDLQRLITRLIEISSDILVYTGYKAEELDNDHLKNISVLIDGKYIEERNNNCILRGSDNQRIIYLDKSVQEKYSEYLINASNQIQNFTMSDGIISVGIHKSDFLDKLNAKINMKGLKSNG